MFESTLQDLFFESFKTSCGLSQLFLINGMIISKKLGKVFEAAFLGDGLQFLLSRQGVEGFERNIDVSVDFHGKYFIGHH